MKVFIVGKYNTFINTLIKKFHKENDKIYVLTGDKYYGSKPRRVFEQYVFPYSGDSIIEILDSVRPDVIIFTGAYDSNFMWQNLRSESMHYISGLTNLIMSAEAHNVKNFIYLSSQDVFEKNNEEFIRSNEAVSATDYRSIAIAQGEDLCRHFNSTSEIEISIIRIDNIYKTPKNREELTDPCSRLCADAILKGSVDINNNKTFSMIHVEDAVFGLYEFVHAKKHKKSIYHLSSMRPITELDIVDILKGLDNTLTVSDNTIGSPQKIMLDSNDFRTEFEFKIFHFYEDEIPDIYKKMKAHKKRYKKYESQINSKNIFLNRMRSLITAILPFIENCVIFIPVFMINNRAVGSQYFDKLDFFLLYVLLFAGVYGTKQAIFSATLSVAGYCFRQLYNHTGIEILIDYNTYLWIAQLFIVAMAVGRLRDSTQIISSEKNEEISFLKTQLDDIVNINESNNRIKNIYQDRIINYDDSLVKIYDITSKLDTLEAGAVLFYAADIIGKIIGTKDVAIYQIANSDYCRLFSATTKQAKVLGKSLKYSDMPELLDAINNHKIYINRSLDEDYPLLASAIYRSDKPIEIIMLWGLPFDKMTLYQCNLLTVLSYMIYNSVERADRYLEALSTTRFIPDTNLLTTDAFDELYNTYSDAMSKGFTEFTVLKVSSELYTDYTTLSNILSSKLRLTDYIGLNNNGEICILLTNSNINDAQFIISRFNEIGITCTPDTSNQEVLVDNE